MKVQELRPVANDVDALRLLPALDDDEKVKQLQAELPAYHAEADGVRLKAKKN